jgi:CubicO group peptidase (beta-lactamase class C family)
MPMRVLLVVCLVLTAPVQSPSQNPGETLIERRVAEHLLPGAVLLVARNGQIETLRAFGHADIEEQRAMRTNTLFRLASAAKIVTTAGILALVDDGRVELDRPVATYLPEFRSSRVFTDTGSRPAAQPLRVRDLLRHTSGYGYGNDPRQGTAYEQSGIMRTAPVVSWSHDLSLADWSERLSTVPLTSDPGTRFEYGLGADVAGAVIERVSGQPLDEFLQNRIFAPLEMVDTGFVVSPARADRLASANRADDNRLVRSDDG